MWSNGAKFSVETFILILYGVFGSYGSGQCMIIMKGGCFGEVNGDGKPEFGKPEFGFWPPVLRTPGITPCSPVGLEGGARSAPLCGLMGFGLGLPMQKHGLLLPKVNMLACVAKPLCRRV